MIALQSIGTNQSLVKIDLNRSDVVELHQPITPSMQKIQQAILDIMDACIKELKKSNLVSKSNAINVLQLDFTDITVDDGLFKEFDLALSAQLELHWNKIGPTTKQLVSDLSTLRKLLLYVWSQEIADLRKISGAI